MARDVEKLEAGYLQAIRPAKHGDRRGFQAACLLENLPSCPRIFIAPPLRNRAARETATDRGTVGNWERVGWIGVRRDHQQGGAALW